MLEFTIEINWTSLFRPRVFSLRQSKLSLKQCLNIAISNRCSHCILILELSNFLIGRLLKNTDIHL